MPLLKKTKVQKALARFDKKAANRARKNRKKLKSLSKKKVKKAAGKAMDKFIESPVGKAIHKIGSLDKPGTRGDLLLKKALSDPIRKAATRANKLKNKIRKKK